MLGSERELDGRFLGVANFGNDSGDSTSWEAPDVNQIVSHAWIGKASLSWICVSLSWNGCAAIGPERADCLCGGSAVSLSHGEKVDRE